ncbi:unnamed protein product [Linum tenue]|uniref:Mechanosensitive ion channel protein n=2 Tax=Linum tenue TaxID=586396 RepID=A0AAV0JH66_9ROSI|nr:unnamed protein product [Linum tenue]
MSASSSDRREVLLKMNGGGASPNGTPPRPPAPAPAGNIWRESSYDFLEGVDRDRKKEQHSEGHDDGSGSYRFDFNPAQRSSSPGENGKAIPEEDPTSKLIGQFLHKQQASGEFCLDMDLEMAELQNGNNNDGLHHLRHLAPVSESPVAVHQRVSFESSESIRRRQASRFKESPGIQSNAGSPAAGDGGGEVLKCSSREGVGSFSCQSSFKRKSNLFKEKTKSRLMDPPQQQQPNSQPEKSGRMPAAKSGQLKSGYVGRSNHIDEEEDDPLLEEDLPEGLKEKLGIWTILEWVSLILLIAALVCSLTIRLLKQKHLWNLPLWKWEVMVLVLICGRLVSGWVIRFIVFFIERNFLLRKRVLYFVYGVKKPVQNSLWLGLVLIAWHFLFDKKVEKETGSRFLRYVTKVLLCLVVGTLIWLVKTLIVKVLASSFHMSTYFDRIQESLFNQYVIETLSGPPLIEIQRNEEEEGRLLSEVQKLQNAGVDVPPALKAATFPSPQPSKVIGSGRLQKSPRVGTPRGASGTFANTYKEGDDGITIDHLHKLNHQNVSAWNMKRLMNIIRHGALSTLDEQIKDSIHDDDESTTKIRSEYEAKAAARKIFQNVAKPGSRFIYFEDLLRFMQEDEATKAMSLYEGAAETQKISKSCLKNWVVNAFRERRALALTLNDTKTAVNKLHRMVNVLVAILIIVIWLLMLGIATTKFLLFMSSQLVLVAFVFGNTCKTVFEAIVFLFVMHPFDVGDRCEIDGVQMVVEEMNILTTIFLRFDNQKIIIPNSVLATKAIGNYYRSPDMGDGIDFFIHVATPAEKIAAVRQRINAYVDNKKEHWYPSPMVVLREAEDLNKVRISVWPCHRINHQDMGERFVRRSLLIEEMVRIFKELDMQFRLLPVDVNVRAVPPVSSERVPPSWALV